MPEIKNNFLQGKMNKDLDERIIPKGEYIEAQNVAISESEDSDVGAIETIRGNKKVNINIPIAGSPEVIGHVRDVNNKRIIYFITNFAGNDAENIRKITRAKGAGSNHNGSEITNPYNNSSTDNCIIAMYNVATDTTHTLLEGAWLNFSKNHLITGAQVIDDLLFFTDDYNQPRKINIAKCLDHPNGNYYQFEDQISVAKYAPYLPIRLTDNAGVSGSSRDGTITSEYMKDKFIRFSYRYKFEDGEYSLMAPFTQIVFEPLNNSIISNTEDQTNQVSGEPDVVVDKHTIYRTGKVNIMQNKINKVLLRIPVPNINERDDSADYSSNAAYSNDYKIQSIDILVKESDGVSIKLVKTITLKDTQNSDFEHYTEKFKSNGQTYHRQVLKHTYKSQKPFQVLPEDQLTRVFDQVPIRAKSLDIVSNRLVFGNYIENYDYPLDFSGKKGINFTLGQSAKGDGLISTATHGHIRHDEFAYKYHSLKQRRTYQVGIVFADKYGRQSPVILSSSENDDSDTLTINPSHDNKSSKFNNAYSWSDSQAAYGLAMKILFQDTQLFKSNSDIYDSEFNAGYNPHGWYSWRLVVKQTQQEYYNVYTSHPFQNWDNIENEPVSNGSNFRGKSWLSLVGDNINKVPRNINDQDINRDGISGSDVDLYPKVLYKTDGTPVGNVMPSEQFDQFSGGGSALHELVDVISLGNAFEQSLFVSSDDNTSGTGGFSVYNFVYAKDKNPLIAELANMKRYYDNGTDVNGNVKIAYVAADTSDSTTVTLSQTADGAANFTSSVNGFTVNGSRITNRNKPTKVVGFNGGNSTATFDSKQTLKKGDYLIFSIYKEGLSVFETEPFESKIDIFYETSTCGLVQDLNEDVSEGGGVAGSPSNILFHTTSSGTTNVTGYAEATNSGTLGFVKATDNSGSSNLAFFLNSATTGNDLPVGSKFSVNQTTGEVTIIGGTAFKGTNQDNITIRFEVQDPDSGSSFADFNISVTNSAPTFTASSVTRLLSTQAGSNAEVFKDTAVTNGSSLSSDNSTFASGLGQAVSFSMGNSSFNSYFTASLSGNTLIIRTTSAWTVSNGQAFFNSSQSNRTMTITLNDGQSSNNTSSMTLIIDELASTLQVELDVNTQNNSLDICDARSTQDFWVTQNTASNPPTQQNGYYTLHVGNKIFTNSTLTNAASFTAGFYRNPGTTNQLDSYKLVLINTSGANQGVITSINDNEECDDRES